MSERNCISSTNDVWPVWRNGRAFACDPKDHGFESPLPGYSLGQAAHTDMTVTKQYNLVPTDGW